MGDQSIMRTGYPQTQKTGACIAVYLAFCTLVHGLFGFGFYKMLQPRYIANVGLAAYKPPIAAEMGYDPTERVAYIGPMLTEDGSYETFDETTFASNGSNPLLAVMDH